MNESRSLDGILYCYRLKKTVLELGYSFEKPMSPLDWYDFINKSQYSQFKVNGNYHKKAKGWHEMMRQAGANKDDIKLFEKINNKYFFKEISALHSLFVKNEFLRVVETTDDGSCFLTCNGIDRSSFLSSIKNRWDGTRVSLDGMGFVSNKAWSPEIYMLDESSLAPFVSHYKVENGHLVLPCGKRLMSKMLDEVSGSLKCAVLKVDRGEFSLDNFDSSYIDSFEYDCVYHIYSGPLLDGIPASDNPQILISYEELEKRKREYIARSGECLDFKEMFVVPAGKERFFRCSPLKEIKYIDRDNLLSRDGSRSLSWKSFHDILDDLRSGTFYVSRNRIKDGEYFYSKTKWKAGNIADALKENIVFSAFDVEQVEPDDIE